MLRTVMPILLVLLVATCAWPADLQSRAAKVFKPLPAAPPPQAKNADRILLGKMLYFEPRLSASSLISCNTCHNVGIGGADLQETSVGHKWQSGPRNAPTVLNAVYNVAQFWDGRAKDLAEQAKGPMQANVEMGNSPDRVVATLKSMPEYPAIFAKAFPGEADPVTFDNVAKAIEAFEATLVTPNARFDSYLKGDKTALSQKEAEGLKLFMDKGCSTCHGGMNIGGNGYYQFGLAEDPDPAIMPKEDRGRVKVTKAPEDTYVFRSPTLRNVAVTAPYFHSGKVWGLPDAVAVMASAELGEELPAAEKEQITAFLYTLTGDQPKVEYPILPASTASTPKPQL